jgi:nickel-dependent lactate racemase
MKADLKIITGLIEPHLLAGYSGGRKAICPGLVSIETIHFAHGHRIIDHPKATIGLLQGNPLHEEALFMARKAGVDFCLNVTINKEKKVTGVFAGNFEKAHDEGVKFLNRFNKVSIPEKPDIIITTAGGAPLDNTFYQSIKGPNSIKRIIKKGGVIILASACCEGVGSAEFRELLLEAKSVNQIMARIRKSNFFRIDQWMVQHLCHVLERAEVYFYSHNLKPELIRRLLVKPISSVEEGIKLAFKRIGPKARILVIPDGPYVIPFLR